MFINFEETLESKITESDNIEKILRIIMDQQYSLKAGLKLFEEKGGYSV